MEEKKPVCTTENYDKVCPIKSAHYKLEMGFHFLLEMVEHYHDADAFLFSLNAFITSIREVTFMLQTYKDIIPDFDNWYNAKQKEMKSNKLLNWINESRTILVHKGMLATKSNVQVGLFRGRRLKLAITFPISDLFIDSKTLFDHYVPKFTDELPFIDKEHSAIGEQVGIKRTWMSNDLGDKELFEACYEVYILIADILREAHDKLGYELLPQGIPDNYFDGFDVILESDVDPTLPKKWGWE